jgi:hypothetical protein
LHWYFSCTSRLKGLLLLLLLLLLLWKLSYVKSLFTATGFIISDFRSGGNVAPPEVMQEKSRRSQNQIHLAKTLGCSSAKGIFLSLSAF